MGVEIKRAAALGLSASVAVTGVVSAEDGSANNQQNRDNLSISIVDFVDDFPVQQPPRISEGLEVVFPINSESAIPNQNQSQDKKEQRGQIKGKFKKNLFDVKGFSFQDPNMTTCGPVAVEMALNFIALRGEGGEGFDYKVNTSYGHEMELRRYARSHDALFKGGKGTDPLGIVKTINEFGWNGEEVYEIKAYEKYDNAANNIVRAIARFGKPVIIAGWGGAHAQLISGYKVVGEDPELSNKFRIKSFKLTSPLRSDRQVNKEISYKEFRNGAWNEEFRRYNQGDSPYDNPLTPIKRPASNEWDEKFVIIVPTK